LKSQKTKTLNFRIVGNKLPGIRFNKSQGALVQREPVYLGIQQNSEVIDFVPGNAPKATFDFSVELIQDREIDFRGPFVHGKKRKKFLYLCWGELQKDGNFLMFRRAKLHFSAISGKDLLGALKSVSPRVVEGTLDLTDDNGGPICATVDSRVKWRIRPSKRKI
jgi:Family of unknown function (DUF5990)